MCHNLRGIRTTAMVSLFYKRQDLENFWGERTQIASHRYQRAKQASYTAYHLFTDEPASDGYLAFRRALRDADAARAEYRRVLTMFVELLLEGKLPDEARNAALPVPAEPPRTWWSP